jgi:hypothetical protein
MSTSDRTKLEKLKIALEYAKKRNDELKIIRIKEDIKQVNDRIKKGR